MKQFLLTFAAVILAAILLMLLPLVIISAVAASSMSEPVGMSKPHTVITLDLSSAITDRDMDSPAFRVRNAMSGAECTHGLNTLAKKLETAASDDNVVALYLKGTDANVNAANMRPLRAMISKFKEESGKPVYFYDEVIGSDKLLYVASAGDSIFISPEGSVAMYGAIVSKLYFKRIAEKLGVGFDVLKHGRYKSAVEPFFRTSMSDDDKAQSKRIVDVVWAEVRDSIAESRNVAPERIDEFVDNIQSLTTRAEDLKQVGLVDDGLYYDQFEAKLAALADCEVSELNFMNIYDLITADYNNSDKKIAVVYAQGQIFDGSSESDDENIYADDLAKTLRKLRNDDNVASVVLRVNSPGGSALASDIIWREVKLLREQKSVVVSMGGYAASGGYYISCAANYIYAEPTTLTGSIGVYGMVPNVEKAADNIGVDLDVVGSSKAPIVTGIRALTDGEKAVLMNSIERTYKTFVTRVSDGRLMSYEAVDSIGQGRVWMGADAVENGLVDEIGSLDDAIEAAAGMVANLGDYEVVEYPEIDDSPLAVLKSLGLSVRASVGHYLLGSDFDRFDRVRTQLQSSPTSVWAICDTEVR